MSSAPVRLLAIRAQRCLAAERTPFGSAQCPPKTRTKRCPMGSLHFLGRLFLALSDCFLNSSITSFRCLGSAEELTCLGSASEVTARVLTPFASHPTTAPVPFLAPV